MKGSFRLFKISGIAFKVHWSFLLLPILFGSFYGWQGIFLVFFVFCCVAAHELCHSLQARKLGVGVQQIVLLPIGGIAQMQAIPDEPNIEFKISVVGPLFNIILAVVLFFPAYWLLGAENLFQPGIETWPKTFAYAFWINPLLAVFNLLPAFPMDGGRILRACLAQRIEYGKATRIAVGFGHAFAAVFGIIGLISVPTNPILIVIAFFIFIAASAEGMQVDLRLTLKDFTVQDILPEQLLDVAPEATLGQVLDLSLHSHQEDFPVVENGRLVGLLTRAEIISGIQRFTVNKPVAEIMRAAFPIVGVNDSLVVAHRLMEQWQLKAIPVINQENVAGIVSLTDINRAYLLTSGKKRKRI